MIVTRRRRKPFPWKRVAYAWVAVLAVAAALLWMPARERIQRVWKPLGVPFDVIGQQKTIAAQNAQIARLTAALSGAENDVALRDRQISRLTTQLAQAQQDAVNVPTQPSPQRMTRIAATSSQASDIAESASPQMRRTAQVWSSMDPDAAAGIVQRLPDAYVARVLAVMSPDAVGAILENVPSPYAARLTQEHPELKR